MFDLALVRLEPSSVDVVVKNSEEQAPSSESRNVQRERFVARVVEVIDVHLWEIIDG